MLNIKTIVVREATDKGKTIQIVDADKLKFTIWKTHSKGGSNPTFDKYQSMGGVGATLTVSYEEKDDSFTNNEGKVINYKKRTIYDILPEGSPNTTTVVNNSPMGQNLASNSVSTETFWDMKAYKQCLWGYWLHHSQPGVTNEDVYNKFKEIEEDAKKRFTVNSQPLTVNKPQGMTAEESLVESIPF